LGEVKIGKGSRRRPLRRRGRGFCRAKGNCGKTLGNARSGKEEDLSEKVALVGMGGGAL